MAWWQPAWNFVDQNLQGLSKGFKAKLALVRLLRNTLIMALLIAYGGVAAAAIWPEYLRWFLIAIVVALSLPAIFWLVIVNLPLKAKSITRLVDMGYPANAKELAIRMAARKLRDQSIETEEMLVETAFNEGRKAYSKYKARAVKMAHAADKYDAKSGDEPADKP